MPATKGDYLVSDASGQVAIKNLALSGKLTLGNVGGDKFATAGGAVDLTYGTTNIKGTATLTWAPGTDPLVSFTGALKSGETEVGSVKGTVDGSKITFSGQAQVSTTTLALKGAVEGVVFYGPNLSAEKIKNRAGTEVTPAKGDFAITSASGQVNSQGITLLGKAEVGGVGAEKWVTGNGTLDATYGAFGVKGTADLEWVIGKTPVISFTGALKSGDVEVATAKGTINDQTVVFSGTGKVAASNLALSGAVEGTIYYGSNLTGLKVKNHAGTDVQVSKNDVFIKSASAKVDAQGFQLTGAVEIGLVGTEKWVKGGGSVDATFGATNVKAPPMWTGCSEARRQSPSPAPSPTAPRLSPTRRARSTARRSRSRATPLSPIRTSRSRARSTASSTTAATWPARRSRTAPEPTCRPRRATSS